MSGRRARWRRLWWARIFRWLRYVDRSRIHDASRLTCILSQLIQHTQLILDAHLPSLLAYAPAHDLIQQLHATLQPLLVSQTALLAARGTIEAFVKLNRRAEKQARGSKKGKAAAGAGAGAAEGTVFDGVYSVEEIQL